MRGKTYSDYASEDLDIRFLALYEIGQRAIFSGLVDRGGRGIW